MMSYLDEIQRQNDQRRETLRELEQELQHEKRQQPQPIHLDGNDASHISSSRPSMIEKIEAAQVELEVLQDSHKQSLAVRDSPQAFFLPASNATRSSFPACLEKGESVEPATERKALLEGFGEEIVDHYNDLLQTSSFFESLLERAKNKLKIKRDFTAQQEDLRKALDEELRTIRNLHEKSVNENHEKESQHDKTSSIQESNVRESLQSENQFLRQQLAYVAVRLVNGDEVEKAAASLDVQNQRYQLASSSRMSKKRKASDGAPKDANSASSTLDQVVLAAMDKLLDDPLDPYLFLGSTKDRESHDRSNEQDVLKLLKHCKVVEAHPDNERLIRLTDYRK
jgi:hypothetical protein